MAGFVAANLLRGDHPQISIEEFTVDADPMASGYFLLDVRAPEEFAAGSIPGATNIPIDELRDRIGELPGQRPIVAFCQVGQRGYLATRILQQAGFDVVNLSGGYRTYLQFQQTAPQPKLALSHDV
jgi:rhodanese-related sulfurtransferase